MGELSATPLSLRIARAFLPALAGLSLCASGVAASGRQGRGPSPVRVSLVPLGREISFPGSVDSNSPLFWNDLGEMVLFTSFGQPLLSVGPDLQQLTPVGSVAFDQDEAAGRRWLESVIRTGDGTLYGYYHSEPHGLCGDESGLTEPQIGAAVSLDDGLSWRDLGIVLRAPGGTLRCETPNSYFAGGVGDFSVVLDPDERYAYFFISSYSGAPTEQGVSVARLSWAERDRPAGKLEKFFEGLWLEPGLGGRTTAIFPAARLWDELDADAYWGPSVHWNTELRQYVMLLNHNIGTSFTNEGIYVSFAADLADPASWSAPEKIVEGGGWYPQVIGLESERGTDKQAGREAWFCVHGVCAHRIVFEDAAPASRASAAGTLRTTAEKAPPPVMKNAPARRRGRRG
jgi:hypothetical protein